MGPAMTMAVVVALVIWLNGATHWLEFRALATNRVLGRNVRCLRRWVLVLSAVLAATAWFGSNVLLPVHRN